PGGKAVEKGLRVGEQARISADERIVPQANVEPVAEFHRDACWILVWLEDGPGGLADSFGGEIYRNGQGAAQRSHQAQPARGQKKVAGEFSHGFEQRDGKSIWFGRFI